MDYINTGTNRKKRLCICQTAFVKVDRNYRTNKPEKRSNSDTIQKYMHFSI